MKHPKLLFVVPCLFFASCAADRDARRTAADLTQAVNKYEAQLDTKIAAEKAFYDDTLATLRKNLGGNDIVTGPKKVADGNLSRPLPYLRIITRANREARETAGKLVGPEGAPSMATMMEYIDSGVGHEQEDYLNDLQRQRQLATTLSDNLSVIDPQRAELAEIRDNLTTLSKPKSSIEQVKAFAKFAQDVKEASKPIKP